MTSNKGGSGKGDGTAKPKTAGSAPDPKKPTPIIDLKATEVKGKGEAATPSGTKPGASTATPTASTSSPGKPGSGDAGSAKSGSGTASTPSAATSTTSTTSASPSTAGGRSTTPATGGTKPGAEKGDAAKAAKTANGGKADDGKAGDGKKTPSGGGTGAASTTADKPQSVRNSGGGVWRTFTHLAAGVAGGALVLLGAKPIEQELGMEFVPRAAIPAEYGDRLAALEARPVAQSNGDIAGITAKLAAAETKLAVIDDMQQRVTELTAQQAELSKLSATVASSGGGAGGGEVDDALKQRLVKLEQSFETLTTATGSDGERTGGARIAAISGKLADVETTLNNQIVALRESVTKELEERVAKTAEASAAAQAGTKRIDRELATIKTEAARLVQRAETLRVAQDRLTDAMRVAREEAAKLRVDLDGLKGSVARPADVANAVQPMTAKLAALQGQLDNVVASEGARKANAQRIVMALELGNLKRVLNRGGAYAEELAEVKRVTGGEIDLGALEKFQAEGVPTNADLQREFRGLAYTIIRAEDRTEDGTMFDRLIGGAKSLVRVRRADLPANDNSTEATVARIERQLKQGNLSGALSEAENLPEKSMMPAKPWLERVAARANVDRAIAAIESKLKSSLGGAAGTKG